LHPICIEKIILADSRIPPAITLLKPLSAAISIGTGGPFGAEGPIIATGAAFGSFTGQWIHISAVERKVVLAAGACAGMSAIFGSPLAAILLAVELLLFEFSARSVIPVALACITGAGMHILLFGHQPVFAMPAIPTPSNTALAVYVLLGAFIGVVAAFVSRSVYWIEDAFEKLPIHWMWWPALGAVVIGVVGYFAPHTMGVGYDNIQRLLTGTAPLAMIAALCFLKYLSWSISPDRLAVRDDKDGDKLIGIITARSLLAFYSRHRQKEQYYESPASTRRILVRGRKLLLKMSSSGSFPSTRP